MSKNLGLISICLLLMVSCKPSDKTEQPVEKNATDSITIGSQDSVQNAVMTMDDEQMKREEESAQFCKDFSIENFIAFLKSNIDPTYAQKCGLTLVYEVEEQDEEEEGLTYYRAIYGRDIEKGQKLDFGYDLKATTSHACFFEEDLDTSSYYSMNFANEDDAKNFYEKLLQYGVLECDGEFIIPEEKLPAGKIVHVKTFNDYNPAFSITPPELKDGFYQVKIDPFQ